MSENETHGHENHGHETRGRKRDEDKPLADRRAEGNAPQEDDHDFGDEHAPGPTDPPIAEAETPGGEDDGYSPQTEIPG